ncbi:MAG: hypothetical protein IT385_21640 [Deltaproteobacteria bacterium]|nr:hypothetical protein [Deltaproteobacteria bacterium]
MRLFRFALALTLPLAASACGDDDGGVIKTITYTGTIVNGVDLTPLAGVQICFISESTLPCVNTNSSGAYSISNIPAEEQVEVEVTKEGFVSVAANFISRASDFSISAQMFPEEAVEAAFALTGETFDDTKGGLLVRVYDPALGQEAGGLAGVAVDIEPSAGIGPFYSDGLTFNTTATETTAVGNAIFGNLDTRSYRVSFDSDTHDCAGTYHWKASDGRLDAVVKAGFATYMYVDCTAKAP